MGIKSRLYYSIPFTFIFLICFIPRLFAEQGDSSQWYPLVVNQIIITGNKITRTHIVMRELVFHEGDTLPFEILENAILRSRENLMNTGLFNFIEINKYPDATNHLTIQINVTERWYLWPFPFFEVVDRNFNEWWLTKDFNRANYGLYLEHNNFRGRAETLKLQVRLGYSQRLGLYYNFPYINKKQNLGIGFGGNYTRNHEIAYATEGNKLQFLKVPDQFIRKDWTFFSRLTYRTGIYDYYSSTIEYRRMYVNDTVLGSTKHYFIDFSDMQQQVSMAFKYRHDQRDYQPYALKGHLFEIEVAKIGLGMLPNEPDLLTVNFNFRHYFEWLPRWHSSFAFSSKVSGIKATPYVNLRALGYGSDLVRGFEYYVVNGENFYLIKSTLLKYTLLTTRVYTIPFITSEKFREVPNTIYLSISADAGYVTDRQFAKNNPLSNNLLSGYGAGIDYVTYYDMVLRFEYSINSLGESGFFINFASPF